MSIESQKEYLTVAALPGLVLQRGYADFWIDASGVRSWFDFGVAVEAARLSCAASGVSSGSVLVLSGGPSFETLAWLFGAAAVGAVIAPLHKDRLSEALSWTGFLEVEWRVEAGRVNRVGQGEHSPQSKRLLDELRSRGHPGLILSTGGSTGTPKLLLHDLASLLGTVAVKDGRGGRTMPLMRFDHIGGLDMAWRAMAKGQVLVAPPESLAPDAVAEAIARYRVEILPATPSFLNLLLMAGIHQRFDLGSLRLVPYGAEPMPAGLLSRLREALPRVEFIERFGTSETGALPVLGKEGSLTLREGGAGFGWKIVDNELWVKSPARALGYLSGNSEGLNTEGWFQTGDFAEERPGGAIRLLGRREEVINSGGEKILPGEIESALLAHPQVEDCLVGSAPNAILGQVVAVDVVWRESERNALEVKRELHRFIGGTIARHKLPTIVRLVDSVESTRNLKKLRVFKP